MVVSFRGARPGDRYGDNPLPFTTVRFEAAETEDGTFVVRDTQDLDPVDTDPAAPQLRNLSTDLAEDGDVFWRLVFVDADDNEEATEVGERLRIRPSVADVGKILRARTRSDQSGTELGTFDATTSPTGDEVAAFIDDAILEVQMRLGVEDIADPLNSYARRVICDRVAMDIELSYTPDKADSDGGAFTQFRDLYEAGIGHLSRRLAQADGGPRRGARVRTVSVVSPDGLNDPDAWWALP